MAPPMLRKRRSPRGTATALCLHLLLSTGKARAWTHQQRSSVRPPIIPSTRSSSSRLPHHHRFRPPHDDVIGIGIGDHRHRADHHRLRLRPRPRHDYYATTSLAAAHAEVPDDGDQNTPSSASSSRSVLDEFDVDDESDLPLLVVGNRVGSGSYGTVHQGYLLLLPPTTDGDDDDDDGDDERRRVTVRPCIAKRAWTLPEISADVPSLVAKAEEEKKRREEELAIAQRTGLAISKANARTGLAAVRTEIAMVDGEGSEEQTEPSSSSLPSESERKKRSERCEHYWEVERHCFRKMKDGEEDDDRDPDAGGGGGGAAPSFLGVFRDDGTGRRLGGGDGVETVVPGYGLAGGTKDEDDGDDGGWFSGIGAGKGDNGEGEEGHRWMAFEFVGSSTEADRESSSTTGAVGEPAKTLLDAMETDWKDRGDGGGGGDRHLRDIRQALHLPEAYSSGETLDAVFLSLLECLGEIHECNIVHRDLKPGNLLCDGARRRLRLIDFGSAADLDPSPSSSFDIGNALFSGGTKRVGYDEGIVAISPTYCAPETFVKLDNNPLSFDVFSAGLIVCQLMFNLLDERTDAGFLRQLKGVDYDLDAWLEKELGAKLRVAGFDSGMEYLGERRGLWGLLKRMLESDPVKRATSREALERLETILGLRNGEVEWSDSIITEVAREEAYFETVVASFDSCAVSDSGETSLRGNMPRPLHFLASFQRGTPVGLMLAEASEVDNDDGDMDGDDWDKWQRATQRALPGEVFVRGTESGGQADTLGIFEIGDRLRGVGELPFVDGGFEQAVNLINQQPGNTGSVKLHFDRIPTFDRIPRPKSDQNDSQNVRVVDQGCWKSGGRRGNQEDSFALHEIKNDEVGDVLLVGVFDGHAGTAASDTVSRILPSLFATELLASSAEAGGPSIRKALEISWETTCDTYRYGCDENGECVADYDPIEGILFAETGSKDLFVAGTTATVAAISTNPSGTDEMTILNCGDSRTLVVGEPPSPDSGDSFVVFETRDHSPDDELEIQRLEVGKAVGLDYSIPQCSVAGSYMVVGDYQYALCRSLEGSFVTSKGIVSDPDVTTLDLASSLTDRCHPSVVLACDGLFEVMDNEEVGREVVRMRKEGYKAGDVAKNLCGQALKKGSYDNLSVVVVYLDE